MAMRFMMVFFIKKIDTNFFGIIPRLPSEVNFMLDL